MRLAHSYWTHTKDKAPFDAKWAEAVRLSVATFRVQQRLDGPGPYSFRRRSDTPTETLMLKGYGAPTRKVGLIHSGFRPSRRCLHLALSDPVQLVRGQRVAQDRAGAARNTKRHRA